MLPAVELSDDLSSTSTLFKLVPQYESKGAVQDGRFFRIYHIETSCYLHHGSGQNVLLAAREAKATELFGVLRVDAFEVDDFYEVKARCRRMRQYLAQFEVDAKPADAEATCLRKVDVDLDSLINVAGGLITFVTETDEPDPLKRDGRPYERRQILLREQKVLDLVLRCVSRSVSGALAEPDASGHTPSPFRKEELADIQGTRPQNDPIVKLRRGLTLCMLLFRHILRDCQANKRYAVRFVPKLQELLSCNIQAAKPLTEVCANNTEMNDAVDGRMVEKVIERIREVGCEAKYLEFLMVLCQCNGKAIRDHQRTVGELLLENKENQGVLLQLTLETNGANRIYIKGDRTKFPLFSSSTPRMELCDWLARTSPERFAYFEKMLELIALLVCDRNMKNIEIVKRLLPYEVVEAVITYPDLNQLPSGKLEEREKRYCLVLTRFVQIAIDAYIDHEPHEVMMRINTV